MHLRLLKAPNRFVPFFESQFGNVLCTRTCSSCHNCETCVVINLVFHLKRGHCSAETRSRIIMSLTCKHGIVRLSGSISIRRGIAVIRVTFSIAGGYLPSIQPDLWILREVGCWTSLSIHHNRQYPVLYLNFTTNSLHQQWFCKFAFSEQNAPHKEFCIPCFRFKLLALPDLSEHGDSVVKGFQWYRPPQHRHQCCSLKCRL